MTRTALLLTLFAAACTPADKGSGDDTDTDADTDSDSDTDTDSDTDADTDTDTDTDADPSSCGDYTGFAEGATWVWNYEASGAVGTYTMSITSISGGEVEAETQYATAGTGYTYSSVGTATYTCASDGLYINESYQDYATVAGGSTYSGWSRSTYDDAFVQPKSFNVGDSWDADWTYTVETDTTAAAEYTYSYSYEVDKEEDVTVSAGTYSTLRIVESTYGSRQWVARDVGNVKTDYTELSSYSR